jgi:hypothetical protein
MGFPILTPAKRTAIENRTWPVYGPFPELPPHPMMNVPPEFVAPLNGSLYVEDAESTDEAEGDGVVEYEEIS